MVRSVVIVMAVLTVAAAVDASADPIRWPAENGGNNHYYELVPAEVTWLEAEIAAVHHPPPAENYSEGYLVTITNPGELDFLAANFPPLATCVPFSLPCIWIGGTDSVNEGIWKWEDGPETGDTFYPTGYSAFTPGEPNNFDTGENCAVYGWLNSPGWNDLPCLSLNYYIIEWNPTGGCGNPVPGPGEDITVSDALYVLKVAVGQKPCRGCTCDCDNNKKVTALDALIVLRTSVGQNPPLNCPGCGE